MHASQWRPAVIGAAAISMLIAPFGGAAETRWQVHDLERYRNIWIRPLAD